MDDILLLGKTVLFRPYVFIFLAVYGISGFLLIGPLRTVAFIPLGYLVAWISEFLSIHYGFPYGFYRYIPHTMDKELWVFGVPFMDSLSYVFLSYASYCLVRLLEHYRVLCFSYSLKRILASAFFMVFLDVIIDPVALKGDRWFLGKIHEYVEKGFYFGVPFSNFAGWLLVGFVLMFVLNWLDSPFPRRFFSSGLMVGGFLYGAVLIFNIVVAALIGEWNLFLVDIFLVGSLTFFITVFTRKRQLESGREAKSG